MSKSTAGRGTNGKQVAYGIKKLRELILELAVGGKLVPQDANDEPASVLLEKIAAEKDQLVKEGKIKKQTILPKISDDEKSFGLPNGWEWVRLQDVSSYIQRGKGPKYSDQGEVRVISQKCVQWNGFDLLQAKYVDDDSLISYQPERFLEQNDLLWNSTGTGTVGRIIVLTEVKPKSIVADSHVTVIRPIKINSNFVWCYVAAPGIQIRIEPGSENTLVSGTTNQVELNTSAVIRLVVPIPPLAEQHRIVAKVDELMALCDQLEQQQTDSHAAHQTLVEILLGTLTNSVRPELVEGCASTVRFFDKLRTHGSARTEFEEAWQRIAEHFDTLFTTEHSIDQLKQTLLQLAVMGKLVAQDANDEPASVLLGKIAEEKARLVKEGKIKKQKTLSEEEKMFRLPTGWTWSRIGDIYRFLNGYAFKSEWFTEIGVKLLRNINVFHGETRWSDVVYIDRSKVLEFEDYSLNVGDVVLSLDRPIINTGLKYAVIAEADLPCLLLQRVAKFHSIGDFVTPKYLTTWLESDLFISKVDPGRSNGVPHISTKQIEDMVFAIPPLAEQHRIVAKVDELMALCDALKARIKLAQTTQIHLADALVEQAVA